MKTNFLESKRLELAKLTQNLVALLKDRRDLVEVITKYKEDNNLPLYDSLQEEKVFLNISELPSLTKEEVFVLSYLIESQVGRDSYPKWSDAKGKLHKKEVLQGMVNPALRKYISKNE